MKIDPARGAVNDTGEHERRAPGHADLPEARPRARRGGPMRTTFAAAVEVVTPILGGGSQTRTVDEVDVIRAATVRGHLRFWWRALRGHEFTEARELHDAERALWGCAGAEGQERSAVEVRVDVLRSGEIDRSDIELQRTPGAYALWPARGERRVQTPPAPRRMPGTRFRLTLVAPTDLEGELRDVVRAWLLFGGYGSRTRRGLGSFRVVEDAGVWLPADATATAFEALFGRSIFSPSANEAVDTPWLAGAALHVGTATSDAQLAWTTALGWLRDLRQGTGGASGSRAREPGAQGRPSISNWPEADKIRRLSRLRRGDRWAHAPRHNATPVWPRAGFGLPIVGQFQQQSRSRIPWRDLPPDHPNHGEEPDGFELRWRSGEVEHDRLASPLIVKALPLAGGRFVPCALWLHRAYPAGQVCLKGNPRSAAPFGRLVAPGDTPQFSVLVDGRSLREAFLGWLRATQQITVVAP
jgi:CRISPR-associated protein Cmr1